MNLLYISSEQTNHEIQGELPKEIYNRKRPYYFFLDIFSDIFMDFRISKSVCYNSRRDRIYPFISGINLWPREGRWGQGRMAIYTELAA